MFVIQLDTIPTWISPCSCDYSYSYHSYSGTPAPAGWSHFFGSDPDHPKNNTGWWYTYHPEKSWSSSVGMMKFPIWKVKSNSMVPVTTNRFLSIIIEFSTNRYHWFSTNRYHRGKIKTSLKPPSVERRGETPPAPLRTLRFVQDPALHEHLRDAAAAQRQATLDLLLGRDPRCGEIRAGDGTGDGLQLIKLMTSSNLR